MKTREQTVAELTVATFQLKTSLDLVLDAAVNHTGETDTYDVLAMACAEFLGAYAQGVSFAKEEARSEGA